MSKDLLNWLKAFAVGLITGAIFTVMRINIPAPTSLSSIMGIIGLFLGLITVSLIQKKSLASYM